MCKENTKLMYTIFLPGRQIPQIYITVKTGMSVIIKYNMDSRIKKNSLSAHKAVNNTAPEYLFD